MQCFNFILNIFEKEMLLFKKKIPLKVTFEISFKDH